MRTLRSSVRPSIRPSTRPAIRPAIRPAHLLAGIVLAGLSLSACGDAATEVQSADAADGASATTAGEAGGSMPEGCAPADGSAAKQQQFDAAPPMCLVDGKQYVAVIETNLGTLHVQLRPEIAPITVNNFVNLGRFHYFDGTTCHRAIQNFVVQCGDPTATGSGGPGYRFVDELDQFDGYRIGSVAMANAGPDTNGSQFFIITGDDGAMLPPNYTLFGQVIDDDLGIVAALDAVANPQDGPPLQPIDITEVTIDER